ncbi:hypothetical protein [Rhizobium multihospitium]|uniref:Uncharacterized protein n=1 Tax=Rhizobium multihospitium TaxID=410764 RepID=A0A1C3W2G6_9HYPH|nr:hypothetical protein [Rhizobium multihospitium]SCB34227.1 hypothetical protein GA0061103_4742 [Rhizobium multihospitium]
MGIVLPDEPMIKTTSARRSLHVGSRLVAACVFLIARTALASGSLPPEPLVAGPFSTFAACLAYLTEKHQEQTALAMPKPVAMQAGGTRQTLVSTKGVSQGPGEQAVYEAEVDYQNRAMDVQTQRIVTNISWERYSLSCQGAAFNGTILRGYYLPAMEPAP